MINQKNLVIGTDLREHGHRLERQENVGKFKTCTKFTVPIYDFKDHTSSYTKFCPTHY